MAADPFKEEQEAGETKGMSFWDHLEELRQRLIRAIIFVVIGFCAVYFFVPYLQNFLITSFFPGGQSPLAFLAPTEGFIVRLKLALVGGLFVASPGVFYQFWRFVAPGLLPKEKSFVVPVVITSTVCFLAGLVFAFFVLPYATRFFLSFGNGQIQNTWSFGSYVDFSVRLMIAFGVVFELPLVIYFLVRLGIVTPDFLRAQRRYAIIIILTISAVITPPDIFTMIVLAVPMIFLYELSIVVAALTHRRRQEEKL